MRIGHQYPRQPLQGAAKNTGDRHCDNNRYRRSRCHRYRHFTWIRHRARLAQQKGYVDKGFCYDVALWPSPCIDPALAGSFLSLADVCAHVLPDLIHQTIGFEAEHLTCPTCYDAVIYERYVQVFPCRRKLLRDCFVLFTGLRTAARVHMEADE